MPLDLTTHYFQRVPGTTTVRLKKLTPYLRLSHGDGPPIFLQDGKAWSESGAEPLSREDVPAWFDEALGHLSPEARAAVGWRMAGDPEPAPAPVAEDALAQSRRPRMGRPRGG